MCARSRKRRGGTSGEDSAQALGRARPSRSRLAGAARAETPSVARACPAIQVRTPRNSSQQCETIHMRPRRPAVPSGPPRPQPAQLRPHRCGGARRDDGRAGAVPQRRGLPLFHRPHPEGLRDREHRSQGPADFQRRQLAPQNDARACRGPRAAEAGPRARPHLSLPDV